MLCDRLATDPRPGRDRLELPVWLGKSLNEKKIKSDLRPIYHRAEWHTTDLRRPATTGGSSCDLGHSQANWQVPRPFLTVKSDRGACPYPEPVYTGWSSVHWNATGMPLVDPVYTGIPLEKLSWNSPTLECHWRNLVESAPHWDATGETLTFAAYTGTPLEGLWQPTHAPTHIVKYAE